MNLQEYLTSYSKGKPKRGSIKKRKIKKIPRRGRGFGRARGMNHRSYNNAKNQIDMKMLQLLDKMLGKDKEVDKVIYENLERDRQPYSFSSTIKKPILKIEEGKLVEEKTIEPTDNKEQLMIELGNHLVDYKSKWEDVLAQQNDIINHLGDVTEGAMSESAFDEFQIENQKVKEEVLRLQLGLSQEMNDAKDVNDYKEFITFQNEALNKSSNKFVEVDNRLKKEVDMGKKDLQEYEKTIGQQMEDVKSKQLSVEEKEKRAKEQMRLAKKQKKLVIVDRTNVEELLADANLKLEKSEAREEKLKQNITELEQEISVYMDLEPDVMRVSM